LRTNKNKTKTPKKPTFLKLSKSNYFSFRAYCADEADVGQLRIKLRKRLFIFQLILTFDAEESKWII